MKRENGITLIVLVVTIIILLILSGVTISSITGDDGILAKAGLVKKITETSSEQEAIQLNTTLANMEKKLNRTNPYYVGTILYDRTLENGNKWNIIINNENQIIYGTGWNFICKGTDIKNYGKTQYAWLVNYESGETKQLEENTYTQLTYGSNLAVKEGLVLNIDPINMSNSTAWGDNVKLYGVKEGDGYGWNGTEIKFDGVDDYLEVYNNMNMDEGMTFEFYGNGDNDIRMLGKTIKNAEGWFTRFRLQFLNNENTFQCCMSGLKSNSDWSVNEKDNSHWIQRKNLKSFNSTNGSYITMSVNLKTDTITLYQDGNIIGSTICSDEWLRSGGLTDNNIPFIIGMMVSGATYGEFYTKMSLYACRLYNKVLTDDEVKENYSKTVAYHNLIVNSN